MVQSCAFEGAIVGSDTFAAAYRADSGVISKQLTWMNNWMGDLIGSTTRTDAWIDWNGQTGLTVIGNYFGLGHTDSSNSAARAIRISPNSGNFGAEVFIKGNTFDSFVATNAVAVEFVTGGVYTNFDLSGNQFLGSSFFPTISSPANNLINGPAYSRGRFAYSLASKTLPLTIEPFVANSTIIEFSGSPSSGNSLVLPSTDGAQWTIYNNSSVALTVKTAAGTGVSIAVAKRAIVYSDGTNNVCATADV